MNARFPLSLVLLVLALGCGSDSAKDDPPPPPKPKTTAPPPRPKAEEPIEIKIKGGDQKIPEAGYEARDPGCVSLDFKKADLELVVLPCFHEQIGVVIDFKAHKHDLTLRLTNYPWKEALAMVCEWTRTTLVKSEFSGRLIMKDGFVSQKAILDVLKDYVPPPPEKTDGKDGKDGKDVPRDASAPK